MREGGGTDVVHGWPIMCPAVVRGRRRKMAVYWERRKTWRRRSDAERTTPFLFDTESKRRSYLKWAMEMTRTNLWGRWGKKLLSGCWNLCAIWGGEGGGEKKKKSGGEVEIFTEWCRCQAPLANSIGLMNKSCIQKADELFLHVMDEKNSSARV